MRNNELKQIEINTLDKYDRSKHYVAIVHYKNATKKYIESFIKKHFGISMLVYFNSDFKPVDQHNTYPADTVLDGDFRSYYFGHPIIEGGKLV